MDIRPALQSQYHAGLKTLRIAVEQCPSALWGRPEDGFAAFWRVAYHTLFFTHLYLQKDAPSFKQWSRHRDDAQCTGLLPHENNRPPKACEAYTPTDILEYWREVDGMVDACVAAMDFERTESGFPWYPMGKLEHQLVNLRHLQHHAAILSNRLRRDASVAVPWVGKAS
ncbi:MAG: DinB family protein [Tepidisphaeraceae bacterium]